MNKHILILIVFLTLLSSLVVCVHASQTFTVQPGKTQIVSVNLVKGDSVNGTFSVTGGTGTGVDFVVTDPNGADLQSCNFTSDYSFSFSAPVNGTYGLGFDNSFCSCAGGKTVTLDYSVNDNQVQLSSQAGDNGLSFSTAAVLLIIVILVIVAVVILLTRLRASKNDATVS